MADEATTTELPPQKFVDEMQKMSFNMLNDLIVKRNDLVGRANAANGDRQTLTEQVRENSTDPEIVAAREAYSEAVLRLDELVKPVVEKIIADQSGSVEGLETEISEIDKTLKPGVTFFKKVYGDEAAKYFATQERLKGATVRSSSGGGRRIRGFNVIVTIDGESQEFENFAGAAKYLDVSTGDLQAEFFKKAGTTELKDVPNEVVMTLNVTEVDGDNNETTKEAVVKAYRTEVSNGDAAATPDEGTAADDEPEADDAATSDDVDLESL